MGNVVVVFSGSDGMSSSRRNLKSQGTPSQWSYAKVASFQAVEAPAPSFRFLHTTPQPTTLHRQPTNSRQHQYNPTSTIAGFCNLENSSSNGSKGHLLLLLLPRTIFETKQHTKIPRPDPQNNGMTGNQKTLYASGPDTR